VHGVEKITSNSATEEKKDDTNRSRALQEEGKNRPATRTTSRLFFFSPQKEGGEKDEDPQRAPVFGGEKGRRNVKERLLPLTLNGQHATRYLRKEEVQVTAPTKRYLCGRSKIKKEKEGGTRRAPRKKEGSDEAERYSTWFLI